MTKKLNSFKNIISVLLALLLLGIAAGPASANSGAGDTLFNGTLDQAVSNITIKGSSYQVNGTIDISFTTPEAGLTFNTSSDVVAIRTDIAANNTTFDPANITVSSTQISIPLINKNYFEGVEINITGIRVDVNSSVLAGKKFFKIASAGGYDNSTVSINITAKTPPPVLTTITVSPPTALVVVGGNTTTFTATTLDQYGVPISATVTWTSDNTTVGSINSSTGVFTANAAGTSIITATSGNVSGTATATVTSTNPLPPAVAAWDADNNGRISKAEALAAVVNYFTGVGITKAVALQVVVTYFS